MVVYLLAVCAIILVIAVLISMKKSGHFFKCIFFSALQGTASLLAVNAADIFTGVSVHINWLSLLSGVLFGIPGIIFHILASVIIK